jgi:hypothetical protein
MTIDPKTIVTWIGVLVAAGGVIAGTVKFLFWVIDEIQKRRTHEGFSAPKKTLQLAPKVEGNCWWAMGKMGDDPTMQIVARMFVTNVASMPVRIPHVELRHGFFGRKRVSGTVSVSRSLNENMHGMYDIAPNETRNISCDFWVYPPVVDASKSFTAESIRFFDQFGNVHIVKAVKFKSMQALTPARPKEPEEFPYKISDSVEKEIVSVLKAELGRYEMCGRRVGGLGSVHIVYQGRAMAGIGSDSWIPNSPNNQLIVSDPEAASLKSDNSEALVGYYKGLASDEERKHFRDALLERLSEKRGYLGVSYFIVCVLWNIGLLDEALQKAKRDLPDGEAKVFGLSNILMLLNGLLKYRYTEFTNDMLDAIERFIHGLTEHPFLIPAKIATIRAGRLTAPKS